MLQYLSKSLQLLLLAVVVCCGIYPLALWLVGQTIFPFQANGSILLGPDGKAVGSKLIAQPFIQDEYFQSRPATPIYDVARLLGPIAKYRSGPQAGQLVASDIEQWFQQDIFQGKPHIVAQWATLHPALAQAWIKANLNVTTPNDANLAVTFFQNFSQANPGKFLAPVISITTDGTIAKTTELTNTGSDIQAIFFDMWRQDHPTADLQAIPEDMVTTSASGLDPDITLQKCRISIGSRCQ
jgi:K+-transporting ATPase ATPase C chain